MTDTHLDFYRRLRKRITEKSLANPAFDRIREFLLLAPDLFHLLVMLLRDDRVSRSDKLKIGAAVAYFISPIDLLPEAFLGLLGLADDVVVAAMILSPVMRRYPDVVESHWAGERDLLELVKEILDRADQMVGQKVLSALRRLFGNSGFDEGGFGSSRGGHGGGSHREHGGRTHHYDGESQ